MHAKPVTTMEYKACIIVALLFFNLVFGNGIDKEIVIKSIKSEDGDTFDCIDIMSQPTFLDPRFKNHTIQMMPTSFPTSIYEETSSNETIPQAEMAEINLVPCPSGTIPVWRNYRKNVTNFYIEERLERILMKDKFPKKAKSDRVLHMAGLGVGPKTNFGTSATLNVWQPPEVKLGPEQRLSGSSAYLTTLTGTEFLEVGWFVWPSISGDVYVRIHIFWQDSKSKKQCNNLQCPGFVQVSQDFPLGGRISPFSIYGGQQYDIAVYVFKDFGTGNWWFAWGSEKKLIGYWEKSIFNDMDYGPVRASWGGMVVYPRGEDGPAMGSGHFPFEKYGKTAYVRDPKYVDEKNNIAVPYKYTTFKLNDAPKCYGVDDPPKVVDMFYFGGPPGCKS